MSKKFLRTLIAVLLICSMLGFPTAFADENATVTGSDVNLRSGPGTNFPVIDCLPKGEIVIVTDMSNPDWYAVTHDGVSGYMSSRYLKVSQSEPDPAPAPVEPDPAPADPAPVADPTPAPASSNPPYSSPALSYNLQQRAAPPPPTPPPPVLCPGTKRPLREPFLGTLRVF